MSNAATGLFLYCSAAFFCIIWLRNLYLQYIVTFWSKTTGLILSARVDEDDEDGPTPLLRYEYQVHGKRWESDQIYPLTVIAVPYHSQGLIKKYATGTAVLVYYDPLQPADAVLETRLPIWLHIVTVVVAGGLLIGGYICRL